MTPDTVTPYRIAYVAVAVIYLGYIGVLWRRARRARTRLAEMAAPRE